MVGVLSLEDGIVCDGWWSFWIECFTKRAVVQCWNVATSDRWRMPSLYTIESCPKSQDYNFCHKTSLIDYLCDTNLCAITPKSQHLFVQDIVLVKVDRGGWRCNEKSYIADKSLIKDCCSPYLASMLSCCQVCLDWEGVWHGLFWLLLAVV